MKTIFLFLLIVIALFFALWLIPVESRKTIVVKNRIEHLDRLISVAGNWKKWYTPARDACMNDSGACLITAAAAGNGFRLSIADKQIEVQPQAGLQYSVEISSSTKNEALVIALSPGESANETRLVYAYNSRLLGKIVSFLAKPNETALLVHDIKAFVEDPLLFYGYKIHIEQPAGAGLLTKNIKTSKENLFVQVKNELKQLNDYAMIKHAQRGLHSVSFIPASGDSLEIIAGIAVNKQVAGNDSIRYMKVPAGQKVLVADYNGVYAGKIQVYSALSRYMRDHSILGRAGLYERFVLGTFPDSDSLVVKMQLCFPF